MHNTHTLTPQVYESVGYARVVNYRKDMAPDSQPEEGEVVIPVDRRNLVLGNKHILRNKLDSAERERVIAAYARDMDRDFAVQGPMYRAVHALALRVLAGEKLCLECCCLPLKCHANIIVERIAERINRIVVNRSSNPAELKASAGLLDSD